MLQTAQCLPSGGIATLISKRSCRKLDVPNLPLTIPAMHALDPMPMLRAPLGRSQLCPAPARDLKAGEWRYISTVHGLPVPLYVLAVLWFVSRTVALGSCSTANMGDALRLRRKLIVLQPELLAYARSLTLDISGAEDLVHDAVVRALQFGSAPKQITDLRPWMFRIIKNLFIDRKRRERVHREFSIAQNRLSDIEPARTGDPVEALMVRQAYAELVPRDREILCLVDVLGLTYAEAAGVIDVPVGTVMSRVSRARRAMIERMGETNVRPLRKRRG